MVGLNGRRVYLDWNATAPLRPEARASMHEALDQVGNPSSVHAEGRAAKGRLERARAEVAALVGADPEAVVFTSGATEAAALAMRYRPTSDGRQIGGPKIGGPKFNGGKVDGPEADRFRSAVPAEGRLSLMAAAVEHDCVWAHLGEAESLPVDAAGRIASCDEMARLGVLDVSFGARIVACQLANSETGVLQDAVGLAADLRDQGLSETVVLCDAVQAAGKVDAPPPLGPLDLVLLSAHKLGGPKGVGALILGAGLEGDAALKGGGQERGRRSGTENVAGIAGFGAAAAAARRDLERGVWNEVGRLRDHLEARLFEAAPELIICGAEAQRLPNTSNVAVPGWSGEKQVIQMDLAGFSISAGSACSSGKVSESRVLRAMGYEDGTAASAIRISMGPTTRSEEVDAFADAWIAAYRRWSARRV